jgi:hypothetical protein
MQTVCLPTSIEITQCEHGISSYYYPMGNRGIKFFKNKSERDYSKQNQHLAYLSGLAPEVFENVDTDEFYGYVTESVEMLHNKFSWNNLPQKYYNMIDNLCQDIYNAIDFEVDGNYFNFGIKNSKLVLVDFGYSSNYIYHAR